jgi:hypothetical protein
VMGWSESIPKASAFLIAAALRQDFFGAAIVVLWSRLL